MPTKKYERIFCKYCKEELINYEERYQKFHDACLQISEDKIKRDKLVIKHLREDIFEGYFRFEPRRKLNYQEFTNLIMFEYDDENNVTSLIFHNCAPEIPSSIAQLQNLRRLEISYDYGEGDYGIEGYKGPRISTLPDEIDKCKKLEFLNISTRCSFPESFSNLKNLRDLRISFGFPNSALPEVFCDLTGLETLILKSNFIRLPESFGKLKKLKYFNSYVLDLPESFGELSNLQIAVLDFGLLGEKNSDTNNKSLPDSFGNLSNLKELYLVIDVFPEVIGSLKNLTKLRVQEKTLTSIPSSLINLTNLKYLSIRSENLDFFPSISALENLEYLELLDTQLSSLPNDIGNLKNLKELIVDNYSEHFSNLHNLPETLGNLTNLTHLQICHSHLQSLPETIGQCTNLNRLDIHFNNIKRLPKSLINCKKLKYLNFDFNDIIEDKEHKELVRKIRKILPPR